MPIRQPVVAGRFYPAEANALRKDVHDFLATAKSTCAVSFTGENRLGTKRLLGVMLPHAGYMYCGRVMAATLSGLTLPRTVLLLCPNHTGQGRPLGVWPEGVWFTPLGPLAVDCACATELCAHMSPLPDGGTLFAPDTTSHLREHSIEVLLPFLQCLGEAASFRIVPICVGTQRPDLLQAAGNALAACITRHWEQGQELGIIVSSDMNHYENQDLTITKDALALAQALAADPEGLLAVTSNERISMCGAGPLALALFAAQALGEPWVVQTLHETSAAASGNTTQVVGYAGLRFGLRF